MLDEHPNVVVEFASRISEHGRQPYTSRDFFLRFSDRICLERWSVAEARYQSYWRYLETRDEYFPYSEKAIPPQGMWRIYGIGLPDDVLRKVYYVNAIRIIPGAKDKFADWTTGR